MIVDRFWFLQLSICHKRRQNIFGCDPATTDTFCCCIHLVTVCVSVWDPYSMYIWKAPEICGLGISTFCCCWLAKQNRIGITSNHISWPKSQRIFVLNVSLSNMYFHVTSSLWNWLENTEIQILFCWRRRKKGQRTFFLLCFTNMPRGSVHTDFFFCSRISIVYTRNMSLSGKLVVTGARLRICAGCVRTHNSNDCARCTHTAIYGHVATFAYDKIANAHHMFVIMLLAIASRNLSDLFGSKILNKISTITISACNCNGYSDKCFFDRQLYNLTGHGGHCLDCAANRDGPNCETCKPNFFLRSDGHCINCDCNPTGEFACAKALWTMLKQLFLFILCRIAFIAM